MELSSLIRMGKQISLNIPGEEKRAEKIASHLKSFWTPKMREEFFQYLENNKSEFSQELVDAVKILQTK
jgi:hypothetical protein